MGYALGFLGIITFTLLTLMPARHQSEGVKDALALNYSIYRQAVHSYVAHNKVTGEVSDALLIFPTAYKKQGWQAHVHDNRCIVYGKANNKTKLAIKKIFLNSHSIGEKRNNMFYPNYNNKNIELPSFIPENALVSIMEVK